MHDDFPCWTIPFSIMFILRIARLCREEKRMSFLDTLNPAGTGIPIQGDLGYKYRPYSPAYRAQLFRDHVRFLPHLPVHDNLIDTFVVLGRRLVSRGKNAQA